MGSGVWLDVNGTVTVRMGAGLIRIKRTEDSLYAADHFRLTIHTTKPTTAMSTNTGIQ